MLSAIAGSVSTMNAKQIKIDTIANNLANVNTTGYKRSRADFTELLAREYGGSGIPVGTGGPDRKKTMVGGGATISGTVKNLMSGQQLDTGRPMDLAILGEGFFKVLLPGGEARYTRDGAFSLDVNGFMTTPSGYRLEGIEAPPGSVDIAIAADGKVTVNDAGEITEAGWVRLYKFGNAAALREEGENLFSAAEEAVEGFPGSEGLGAIRQGCLETSNVDFSEETASLMEIQRAYAFSARIIRLADEMLGLANNLRK